MVNNWEETDKAGRLCATRKRCETEHRKQDQIKLLESTHRDDARQRPSEDVVMVVVVDS